MTINKAVDCFEQWTAAKYSKRTIYIYRRHIRQFLQKVRKKTTEELEVMDVIRWNRDLKERGLSDCSIAHAMIALRRLFQFLNTIRASTLDYQMIPIPKYTQNSYKPVESVEVAEMIKKIDILSPLGKRDRAIISFLHASGLRVSELTGLSVADVQGKAMISTIISRKNRQNRMIFWDAQTDEYLKEYVAIRPTGKGDALFVSFDRVHKGERLTTRSIERIIAKYRPATHISPHSFRHGLGMRAVKSGIHPRYIQKILGHKSIASSQIYMDVCDPDVKEAYEMIENGLN